MTLTKSIALAAMLGLASCKPPTPHPEPEGTPPPAPTPVTHVVPLVTPEPSPSPTPTPAPSATPRISKPETFQAYLWQTARIRPEWQGRLDKTISRTMFYRHRYEAIQNMRTNGVPWFIVAGLHERESSQSFSRHLHEGSLLTSRTQWIPKGRLPHKSPPYTFEESAEDALYILKDLDTVDWNHLSTSLQAIEKFNGLGYQKYHRDVSSPYLWSGSSHYQKGKYVADGKFSRSAVDQQIGVATMLMRMNERGLIDYFSSQQSTKTLPTK